MASFIVYDLVFLAVFSIIAIAFFYKRRENLKRHGWMFLYHSKVGIQFIDWTAKKFEKILKPLSYVVIASGYILMGSILWLLSRTVWTYVTSPIPEQLQSLPPIAPLIPYFPKLFGLESFFPPLYFTYFLVALAIVAVSHEFSHGIFARLWKIKVKTTGLAFFGPFFGAFVEPDEKRMIKAPKKHQLSILAAGTFANVVMTILFGLILWGFFAYSFSPAGLQFASYPQELVNVGDITHVNDVRVTEVSAIVDVAEEGLNRITLQNGITYLAPQGALTEQFLEQGQIVVFDDAPAINANLNGAIASIDGMDIRSHEDLVQALESHNPGDEIEVMTIQESGARVSYDITLAERNGNAYLGVGFLNTNVEGFRGLLYNFISSIKDPQVYYEPSWDGNFVIFIYDLLWWIVVINILVALMNMLPVSILDGGRFFYLTMWGITGSEKFGKKAYSFITWFILFLLVVMMARWFIGLF